MFLGQLVILYGKHKIELYMIILFKMYVQFLSLFDSFVLMYFYFILFLSSPEPKALGGRGVWGGGVAVVVGLPPSSSPPSGCSSVCSQFL